MNVTETSPPIWYSVGLLNKNHIIENILEGQIKSPTYGKTLEVLIFSLLTLHNLTPGVTGNHSSFVFAT